MLTILKLVDFVWHCLIRIVEAIWNWSNLKNTHSLSNMGLLKRCKVHEVSRSEKLLIFHLRHICWNEHSCKIRVVNLQSRKCSKMFKIGCKAATTAHECCSFQSPPFSCVFFLAFSFQFFTALFQGWWSWVGCLKRLSLKIPSGRCLSWEEAKGAKQIGIW